MTLYYSKECIPFLGTSCPQEMLSLLIIILFTLVMDGTTHIALRTC